MSKTFAKLTENNDHEGETWRFWIPTEGNEEALTRLSTAIENAGADKCDIEYELDLNPVPESEVDALVKHTGTGYMAYDTKLAGVLTLSDEVLAEIEADDGQPLYKGGIKDLMVVAA